MKTPCTHYAGRCDKLVCPREAERQAADRAAILRACDLAARDNAMATARMLKAMNAAPHYIEAAVRVARIASRAARSHTVRS